MVVVIALMLMVMVLGGIVFSIDGARVKRISMKIMLLANEFTNLGSGITSIG